MEEKDEMRLQSTEDTTSTSSFSSRDDRDLSTWDLRITHAQEVRENLNTNSTYVVLIIEVHRGELSGDNTVIHEEENPSWIVARRYQDFYLLEQKLTEFHGIFAGARLPPKRSSLTTARTVEFLESVKNEFEHFLRHLLSLPILRNSELLYSFLTQPDEFTLPNSEIILTRMFKVVPRRLRTEKGQCLEPFLISLMNYAEPAKPKATQPTPVFKDIVQEKLRNSIYGNNANSDEIFFEALSNQPSKDTTCEETDSSYDNLIFIARKIFLTSSVFIHLVNLLRVPLKNTFDALFSHVIENKVDDLLSDEENIIQAIQALQDIVFPQDAAHTHSIDVVNFEDVIDVADEFVPNAIKGIIGEANLRNGLTILLQHFQNPLLNKQLFYMILDEILFELFPELRVHSETSTDNAVST